jgi:hypothetical protein
LQHLYRHFTKYDDEALVAEAILHASAKSSMIMTGKEV